MSTTSSENNFFSKENYNALIYLKKEEYLFPSFQQKDIESYLEKEELHITIFGTPDGFLIKDYLANFNKQTQEKILALFENFFKNTPFTYQRSGEYYEIQKGYERRGVKEVRGSIVELVSVPEYNFFLNEFKKATGIPLVAKKTHVTLYTKSTNHLTAKVGVGINSEEDFQKLMVRKIEI